MCFYDIVIKNYFKDKQLNKKMIVNSMITCGTYLNVLKSILKLSEEFNSSYVCVSNVHMIIEAHKDKEFAEVVNKANITTADGMPIARGISLLYNVEQDRVAGMDLMPSLIEECQRNKKSIFLYGSTPNVLDQIVKKSTKIYPGLKIDSYSPPFRSLTQEEEKNIINRINEKKYDFIFVALGCPKQEKWMNKHYGKIQSCMIGLGGAFEVYAEVKDRAPSWMQKYSLEWVYRLIQDPQRLWKRYAYTNTMFIYLFTKQYIKLKFWKS